MTEDPRIVAIAEALEAATCEGCQTVLDIDGFGYIHRAYHSGDELHPGFLGTAWPPSEMDPDGVFRTPEKPRVSPG